MAGQEVPLVSRRELRKALAQVGGVTAGAFRWGAALGPGLLATCTLSAQTQANDQPNLFSMSLAELLNVPLEAVSKRPQNLLESPQASESLTADQIRASGVFRLVDVLKLMTSVQVFELGKERAFLSLRGTVINGNMRNVQLLVDGVQLFNSQSIQGVDFASIPIPIDAIERVEVVRGPSSSLYGANAQVGVIAITTRKAGDGSSGSLRAGRAGSSTTNSQGLYSFGSPGFNLALGFGGASQQDSGISERGLGESRRVDPQDQNHGSQVFLRPEVVLGKGRLWALVSQASHQVGPQVVERPADGVQLYQFAFLRSTTEAQQVGWSQAWSSSFRTELKVNRTHSLPLTLSAMEMAPGSPASAVLVPLLRGLDPGLITGYDLLESTNDQVVLQANWDPSATLHVVPVWTPPG
jgi:hypothetical protein